MSMNSSNLTRHKSLAIGVLAELNAVYEEFSLFQKKTELTCPSGCGKCCFKSDIYCTPIELLPMAMDLFARDEAMEVYEQCKVHSGDHCMFMKISDKISGKGMCINYHFRPLVCRTFGVAGTHDKNNKINFSVCTTLKETQPEKYQKLIQTDWIDEEVAFIDDSKSKLSNFDPAFMEKEFPINEALAIMLEKILFLAGLDSRSDNSDA